MQRSCQYCGRIHPTGYRCPMRPQKNKANTKAVHLRQSRSWKQKRLKILERDRYLCQACLRNQYHTRRQYNGDNIQVHHIHPIETAWALRLDDRNLISLCPEHHRMAEKGVIPARKLLEWAESPPVPPKYSEAICEHRQPPHKYTKA